MVPDSRDRPCHGYIPSVLASPWLFFKDDRAVQLLQVLKTVRVWQPGA